MAVRIFVVLSKFLCFAGLLWRFDEHRSRELKQRKFSGRRRLEWQREAGTDVAVASRQIQLFKRQVHSDGDGVAFQRKK